ncbi:MAG: hypothetical protein ACLRSW_11600 [Christensenellaceae bacterium]
MKIEFDTNEGNMGTSYPVSNRVTADFRLDEQLDTGSVVIITDSAEPIPPMTPSRLTFSDDKPLPPKFLWFSLIVHTVEIRGQGYAPNLTLVEPTRLLMGIPIEGMKVTQPQDGTAKDSLYTVAERLLRVCRLTKGGTPQKIWLTDDEETVALLQNTDSPEFSWEAETQLWECLKDIGSVINCMPRLTVEHSTASFTFDTIVFDKINDVTEEREL